MYTRTVSYNNSTFNKAARKACAAVDAAADGDAGTAIAIAESRASGCVSRQFKEIHRAPSEALRIPDKAIMRCDDAKLAVRKNDDDFGFLPCKGATHSTSEFSVKSDKKCPPAPIKSKKQNLAAEFFSSTTEAVVRAAEPAVVAPTGRLPPAKGWEVADEPAALSKRAERRLANESEFVNWRARK